MTKRKRIFLFGGTGFVGTVLTRQLSAQRRENELLMLIHRRARFRDLEQIDTRVGSLASFDLLQLDRFQPESILHLARMSGRGRVGRYFAAWRGAQANRRIVDHLKCNGLKPHTIYVSGTLVYGDCGNARIDETRALSPVAFAREYVRAEKPWMDALERGELPVTILRPPWIIGQGSWFGEFYIKSIRRNRTVPLFGDGKNLMSLLDVEDCAGLIAHAVRHAVPGQYQNLFLPDGCVTQIEFAERVARITGSEIRPVATAEIERQYGRAVREAFTFSVASATKYPEFFTGYRFQFSSVDGMIRNNIPADLLRLPEAHKLP